MPKMAVILLSLLLVSSSSSAGIDSDGKLVRLGSGTSKTSKVVVKKISYGTATCRFGAFKSDQALNMASPVGKELTDYTNRVRKGSVETSPGPNFESHVSVFTIDLDDASLLDKVVNTIKIDQSHTIQVRVGKDLFKNLPPEPQHIDTTCPQLAIYSADKNGGYAYSGNSTCGLDDNTMSTFVPGGTIRDKSGKYILPYLVCKIKPKAEGKAIGAEKINDAQSPKTTPGSQPGSTQTPNPKSKPAK